MKIAASVALVSVLVVGLALATTATGQAPTAPAAPPATTPAPAPQANTQVAHGQVVFTQRCATCHDPAIEGAPNRTDLAAFDPQFIVDTLKNGEMKPMAQGLSDDDIAAIAKFLTTYGS